MNVSLTPELEKMIADKVESGLCNSASEVVREGLRLLKEQDELRRIRLAELRREVQRGVDQLERGEGKPFDADAMIAALEAKFGSENSQSEPSRLVKRSALYSLRLLQKTCYP